MGQIVLWARVFIRRKERSGRGVENRSLNTYPYSCPQWKHSAVPNPKLEGRVRRTPVVFVVSDSMGETAQLVAKAVLSQFPEPNVGLRRFSHVESPDAAREVMKAARDQPTMIIFTVIIVFFASLMGCRDVEKY